MNRTTAAFILSLAGLADSLYMLAYHQGLIPSLVCPIFGEGCNIVGRSPQARHLGIPNAALGAVGYAAMGVLAVRAGYGAGPDRARASVGLGAMAMSAFAAGLFLTWEQGARVRAWCFWCLLSAGINAALVPLTLGDARAGWRSMRADRTPTSGALGIVVGEEGVEPPTSSV